MFVLLLVFVLQLYNLEFLLSKILITAFLRSLVSVLLSAHVRRLSCLPCAVLCLYVHLLGKKGEVGHLEDEVGPDDVEDEEDGEEAVEDVVGGEHGDQLGRLYSSTGGLGVGAGRY